MSHLLPSRAVASKVDGPAIVFVGAGEKQGGRLMKVQITVSVALALVGSALVGWFGLEGTDAHKSQYLKASSAQSMAEFVGKSWEELIPYEECMALEDILVEAIESEKQLSKIGGWMAELDGHKTDLGKIEWFFSIEELRESQLTSARISDIEAQAKLLFQLDLDVIEDQAIRTLSAEGYERLVREQLSNFGGYVNKVGWEQEHADAFSERCGDSNYATKFAAEKASEEEVANFAEEIIAIRLIRWADSDYDQVSMFVAYKDSPRTKCSGAAECALEVFMSPVDCTLDIEAQFSSESEYGKSDAGVLKDEVRLEAFTPKEVEILNTGEGADFWNLESARCS